MAKPVHDARKKWRTILRGIVLSAALITGCQSKSDNAAKTPANTSGTPATGGSQSSTPASMPSVVTNKTGKSLRITVIPKGLTHEHWKAVEAGAKKAGQEAGKVEIIWQGPPKEDDTTQQISLVQNCISSGVDGIVLAPLSDQALVAPVRLAARANIPVVIIDSALRGQIGKDFVAYVGTNNKGAGMIAGKRMADLLKNQGTVMMLRYAESSASTNEREQGFLEALKASAPGVQVIDPPRYAGADVNSAKQAAENMLTAYQDKFTAIYCPNESSTEGMLLALNDRRLSGKTTFVGFDVNKRLIDALKAGKIQGLVLQNPFKMGHEGVRVLLAHMNGDKVPTDVDTGAVLVTPENISKPEIDAVIPASAK